MEPARMDLAGIEKPAGGVRIPLLFRVPDVGGDVARSPGVARASPTSASSRGSERSPSRARPSDRPALSGVQALFASVVLDRGGVVFIEAPDGDGSGPETVFGGAPRLAATPCAEALDRELDDLLARFGRCLVIELASTAAPIPASTPAPTTATTTIPTAAPTPGEPEPESDPPVLLLEPDPDRTPESLVLALSVRAGCEAAQIDIHQRSDRSPQADRASGDHGIPDPHRSDRRRSDRRRSDPHRRDSRLASIAITVEEAPEATDGDEETALAERRRHFGRVVDTAMLFEAFRHTDFIAETPAGRLCLRVGERYPELDALLVREGLETWAYVTAYNPYGRPASDADNRRAQARLLDELRMRGWTGYPGAGQADLDDWPPEPSVLVVGISQEEAVALAARFRQAALLFGRRGGIARLYPTDVIDPTRLGRPT